MLKKAEILQKKLTNLEKKTASRYVIRAVEKFQKSIRTQCLDNGKGEKSIHKGKNIPLTYCD